MRAMRRIRRSASVSGPILLALLSSISCSRRISLPAEAASSDDRVPFRGSRNPDAVAATPAAANGAGPATQDRGLPFKNAQQEIPAGTLLSVKLQSAITVGVPVANDAFEGVVEQPIVIDGNTLIPRGATAGGRVESVFISEIEPTRGYIRLVLESVRLGANDLPLQTTSLFARRSPSDDQPSSRIRLEKGRRLTFRITEPVSLMPQPTQASR